MRDPLFEMLFALVCGFIAESHWAYIVDTLREVEIPDNF